MKPLISFYCRACKVDIHQDTTKMPSWASFAFCDAAHFLAKPQLAPDWETLNTAPVVNDEYLVEVHPPFVFPDLSYTPWIHYQPPYSHSEGWLDVPEEIPLSSIVRVRLINVLSVDENVARIRVRIVETLPLARIVTTLPPQPPTVPSDFWFLHDTLDENQIATFEDFAFVIKTGQGDVGEWAIFQRWESRWRLLVLGLWDFHRSIVYVGHKILSNEELRVLQLS